jgi:hypothetical protein
VVSGAPETLDNCVVTGLPTQIPYSTEQGIILAEQGVLMREQRIYRPEIEILDGRGFPGQRTAW